MNDSDAVSSAALAFYEENGYVQIDDVLTPEELNGLREAVGQAVGMGALPQAAPFRSIVQRINLWREHPAMRQYTTHLALARIARALSGSKTIRLWHDQAMIKPALIGTETPWHQDYPYWPMNEATALSCWIALDDVDEQNGCMRFIPGSHRWGPLPILPLDEGSFPGLAATLAEAPATTVKLRAGSCTFHHGLTLHYAFPNRSPQPRRALKIVYLPDGVTYRARHHCITDPLDLQPGDPLESDWFPVLIGADGTARITAR